MVCAEIYRLTPRERAAIDEMPSDCEIFYGDYPPQVPQGAAGRPCMNWLLLGLLAGDFVVLGLIVWALVALFGE